MKTARTIIILWAAICGLGVFVAAAEEKPRAKVLLIGKQPDHPYATHMYLHTCRMLSESLKLNGVDAVVSDGWPKDPAVLKDVKSIVIYTTPAAELLLDGPHRDEVDRLMKSGVGLVTIHWASSIQKENLERLGDRWMSYLGGTWISNVGLSTDTSQLKQLDPKHPICRGWTSYELNDEYYLNPKIGKDATSLLQVTTKGQDVVVGWAFERPGGGRAYGTTLGHFYRNFEREPFRRTIVNAILWTAQVEVPKEGARIDVKEEFLKLPPEPAKPAEPKKTSTNAPPPFPGKQSDWNGFVRHDFEVDGKPVLVVAPKQAAPGRPWVWHGEFFGHKPAPDIALLKQGFYVVYMQVPDMLGSPQAVENWNKFYAELTGKYGFARKAALVGLSRGGLYCYNWAAANPDKVACIYGDAPVCDFKSWPGGKGKGKGSTRDWKLVLERFGFKDDAEALAYGKNPVDNLEPLAKTKVPLLHVYGDADDVVPWEENTGLIAERYRKLGGEIKLIAKKGVGHHPHGLDDPTPIVEFIASHAALVKMTAVPSGRYYSVTYEPSTEAGRLQLGVTYTLWVPRDVKRLRGIIVHQHGCGSGACKGGETAAYDLHWQALARKWDCALLGPSYHQDDKQNCRLWCDPRNGSEQAFLNSLHDIALASGHAEVETAPWCLWGHSGGGFWASIMQTMHPQRIVAIWLRSGTAFATWKKGEIPAPTIPDAAYQIPVMCNPGGKENGDARFRGAWDGSLAMFKAYRAKGALIGFAPDPRTAHECGDSRYLAIPFFDACLAQRLPEKDRQDGMLRPVDATQAWLAEPLSDVAQPSDSFSGDKGLAMWLPNEQFAKSWSQYVKTGGVEDASPPPTPTEIVATRLADKSVEITWNSAADFESGIQAFVIQRDGQILTQFPEKPVGKFGRPLFQSMSYHDTPERPVSEMRFIDLAAETGKPHEYRVIAINSVGLKSEPSAAAKVP